MNGAAWRRREGPRLFGDLLLEAGVVGGEGLAEALQAQRLAGGRLGWHLMRLGRVVPAHLHLFLESHLEAMRPDLVTDLAEGSAAALFPARLAWHYGMVPVRDDGGRLEIGLSSADAPGLVPAVEALTRRRVDPIICPPSILAEALSRHYPGEIEPGVRFADAGDALFVLRSTAAGIAPSPIETLDVRAGGAAWLRALCAEALARRATRLRLEPRDEFASLTFETAGGAEEPLDVPAGAIAGVVGLVESLARLAVHGRVLPREGRFALLDGDHRLAVTALTLPGLRGRTTTLSFRQERVVGPAPGEHAAALPELRDAIDRLAASGRGLLFVAATSPSEWDSGVQAILASLDGRLPRRRVLGSWNETWPAAAASAPGGSGGTVDLEVIAAPFRPRAVEPLARLAASRVVLATLQASSARRAVEALRRGAVGQGPLPAPAGILVARHASALCRACRLPFDAAGLLDGLREAAAVRGGTFATSPGCSACRGSGWLDVIRVLEFLPRHGDELLRPGRRFDDLRAGAASRPTLLDAVLAEAADGRVDVREVLRMLVHEPR
jgi:hypothetical protein